MHSSERLCVISLNIRVTTNLTYKQIYKNLLCAFFSIIHNKKFIRGTYIEISKISTFLNNL